MPGYRKLLFLVTLGSLLTALALAPSALAAGSSTHGFAGRWTAVDCAAWWEDGHLDCSVWGDGSYQTLDIGRGDDPRIRFEDYYAGYCANNDSPSTHWVAAGYGQYDGPFLWPTYTKSGCGRFGSGGYASGALYYDSGSDTIWEDPDGDGWGLVWYCLT